MNIENLELFCLVVEEGSMSKAARLNFVSQPAITRQIQQLEDYYETLLFNRKDGKLEITEAGRVLYPLAKGITADFKGSKEVIQQVLGTENIRLQIGASLTIGEYLLPKLLGDFKEEEPEVQITLQIGNTPSILDLLRNNTIDLALVEGIVNDPQLVVKKFAEDELFLICSANHPWAGKTEVGIEELSLERMIWREKISGTRTIVENILENYGVLPQMENYMELGSTQSIKGAVVANLGISILSKMSISQELDNGTLHKLRIKGLPLKRNLWIVQRSKRYYRKGTDKFIYFLRQ
jgi:LysR family transcriptional regulator, transcriptional activator of the cysJI operon